MHYSSSIHRYYHIQCYVIKPKRIVEYSLTYCSATRQASFLVFSGYNIASEYSTNGQCQFTLGDIISVSPVYSVSQPAKVNSTKFQSTARQSFYNYLGFSTCSGGGVGVAVVTDLASLPGATLLATPIASNPSPSTPVISGPDQNSTQAISTGIGGQNSSSASVSTHSSGSYHKRVEVANAVAIPVAFLGLALLGFLLYRRRKNQKASKEDDPISQNLESSPEDLQPYLQQKAELEAEEKRKHELEARERRYEIGNEGERYELPVEEVGLMISSRQELRGEEHSKELEGPR